VRIDKEKAAAASATPQNLVLEFSSEEFENICRAAMETRQTPKEWAVDTLNSVSQDAIDAIAAQEKKARKSAS